MFKTNLKKEVKKPRQKGRIYYKQTAFLHKFGKIIIYIKLSFL